MAELERAVTAGDAVPAFKNGRQLRDYQEVSFRWMAQHSLAARGCILGDEMGLGKTAQVRPRGRVGSVAWPHEAAS